MEQVSSESVARFDRTPGQVQHAACLRGEKILKRCSSCGIRVIGNKISRPNGKTARKVNPGQILYERVTGARADIRGHQRLAAGEDQISRGEEIQKFLINQRGLILL